MGYTTYGVSANPYVNPVYGFTGFDAYIEESYFTDIFGSVIEVSDKLKPKVSKYRNIYGNDVLMLSRVIMWEDPKFFFDLVLSAMALSPHAAIKKIKAKLIEGWPIEKGGKRIVEKVRHLRMKKPFFLFVNFMEAHDPYIGKKGRDINWSTPFLKKAAVRGNRKELGKPVHQGLPPSHEIWQRGYRASFEKIRRRPDNNHHFGSWPRPLTSMGSWATGVRYSTR